MTKAHCPTVASQPTVSAPKPAYDPPRITTYTSEEILEQVGPALTCSISPCPLAG